MIDKIYEKTVENKKQINNYFSEIPSQINTELVRDSYNEYTFDKKQQDKTFAALDGSSNSKKYMACFIYALGSQSIVSKPNENVTKESQGGDVNVISTIHDSHINSLLSNRMAILELKGTIDTLQNHPELDYMLIDGDITGKLRNLRIRNELDDYSKDYLNNETRSILASFENHDFEIENTAFLRKHRVLYELRQQIEEYENTDEKSIMDYFEKLELLTCIHYLLKEYSDKIIGVSKTNSTTRFYNGQIPDAATIEYTCRESGYTVTQVDPGVKMIIVDNNGKKLQINYPLYNRELTDQIFTTFFTRLDDNSNVLKIELPYKLEDDDKIIELLNDLYSISIDGYPYILKKAHDEVVIRDRDMLDITYKLGILARTGRDMLTN